MEWKNFWTSDWVSNLHWMGMVHNSLDTDGRLGIGNRPGSNSWVKMRNSNDGWPAWYITGGNSMAHELGHNQGLMHINCDGSEAGGGTVDNNYPWPFPNCSLSAVDAAGYYGFDVYYQSWGLSVPTVLSNSPSAASPNQAFPLMGYQRARWISPYEYCKLLPTYGIPCGLFTAQETQEQQLAGAVLANPTAYADPKAIARLRSATAYIAAGGIVTITEGTGRFDHVYQVDQPFPDAVEQAAQKLGYAASPFALQTAQSFFIAQVNAQGQTLGTPHEIFFSNEDDPSPVQSFLELVPLEQGTARVQLRYGETVLDEQPASATPPLVKVLWPNGGETLKVGDELRWEASDADGDALFFNVLYSSDGGASWRAVALDVISTTLTLPSLADFPGSQEGRIRVVASDGFHTVQDDSDGNFTVPGSPPLAVILNPLTGSVQPLGTVDLLGTASDIEDGPLSGDSLRWTLDGNQDLGTGREVEAVVGYGDHTITLTAMDSDGQEASVSVKIFVGERRYLPTLLKRVGP